MVTYHYVKFYVSIIIHLKVININVRNFIFPIGLYSKPHPLWAPQNMTLSPFTTKLKTLGPTRNIYLQLEILSSRSWDLPWTRSCRKDRKENNNNNKKRSKNNKSPKLCLGDLINNYKPHAKNYSNLSMFTEVFT